MPNNKRSDSNPNNDGAGPSGKKQKVQAADSLGLALPKVDEKKSKGKKGAHGSANGARNQGKAQTDPNKMQDVLFSAGVDIKEEEALLQTSTNLSKKKLSQQRNAAADAVMMPPHQPFLHPDQVLATMRKASKDAQFNSNFISSSNKKADVLAVVSSACEYYMRDIVTNALVISRHRRRGVQLNTGRRSEVSIALKSIALTQRKEEEKRLKKRIALGLEKEDVDTQVNSEETLHRASNLTATLRAGTKKQYGWLTSSVAKPTSSMTKSMGKVANDINSRGDNGLKFREAREEPGIVMRDLLFALENRRMGVNNAITKGYAKIRD
ncbi:Taf4p KNAG_0E00890 [Huiozyma naganishii CBS 8797]|uniref:Transcription initiation factor TFIID subunit 4 n=1 Tax=Huiozyma naganishii (strain ATCC MYA-139 / BCRC 22969 / CBS 8797 / KCTC 17520 / NBRC 10181 / NCYC 3082 / Yp74L-3) TaxID=1071383 RepID=J7RYU5_HUIN7|nr:hypothetical protein KNAG_0E00890 [Kazachstania naganishii CBS 8797]CCK70357.1 hypothetical protein KNAG_0E00890 [Kazachstania naganishii CBS 8797]